MDQTQIDIVDDHINTPTGYSNDDDDDVNFLNFELPISEEQGEEEDDHILTPTGTNNDHVFDSFNEFSEPEPEEIDNNFSDSFINGLNTPEVDIFGVPEPPLKYD